MPEDRYRAIRELPFPVLAQVLGVDISRYKLRKGNTEHSGPCPIHAPKKNSTSFSYANNGAYQCFSCGAKGKGGIDLVKAVQNVGFQEAVAILEPYASVKNLTQVVQPAKQVSNTLTPDENKPFNGATYSKFAVPSDWLTKRGFEPRTLERFGVFEYSNPNRQSAYKGKILIPVRRFDGQLVAYLARDPRPAEIRGDDPKYIWPKDFHKALEVFGAWQLKEDHKLPVRICYILESPFAAMKFWQMGFPAVALFGAHMSLGQLKILVQLAKGFVWLPDSDKFKEIGDYVKLLSGFAWVKCPILPEGIDDPEYLDAQQIKSLI